MLQRLALRWMRAKQTTLHTAAVEIPRSTRFTMLLLSRIQPYMWRNLIGAFTPVAQPRILFRKGQSITWSIIDAFLTAESTSKNLKRFVSGGGSNGFFLAAPLTHASKKQRHKSYFLTHIVTVALSSSKLTAEGKRHWPWPSGRQQKHWSGKHSL